MNYAHDKMNYSHETAPTEFLKQTALVMPIGVLASPTVHQSSSCSISGVTRQLGSVVTDGPARDRAVKFFNNAGVASSSGEPADTVPGMAKHMGIPRCMIPSKKEIHHDQATCFRE